MEEKIFQRKQFTFYESFYHCIEKTLRKKSEKLTAYKALIQYALYGDIEEKENLSDAVLGILEAFYPVLDTARKNAKNAKHSRKWEKTISDAAEKLLCYKENDTDSDIDSDSETENKRNPSDFAVFWDAYPRKVGKVEAKEIFEQTDVSLSVLLDALRQQKASAQWQNDGGLYIPSPAKWLKNKRWTDQLPAAGEVYSFGELELQAIRRMMENPNGFS